MFLLLIPSFFKKCTCTDKNSTEGWHDVAYGYTLWTSHEVTFLSKLIDFPYNIPASKFFYFVPGCHTQTDDEYSRTRFLVILSTRQRSIN